MGHLLRAAALRGGVGFVVLALTALAAPGVHAQAAPPAVVPTPPQVPPASQLAPPPAPPSTPQLPAPAAPPARELGKPEDELRIDVERYVVDDGAPAELKAALPRITARFTGKQRSFEDLVNAAGEVMLFMQRDLGYYLAYAYLPEQEPAGGVVRIAVMEGRLDRVVLNWRNDIPVRREVVEAYLARLVPGSVLKVRDVERVIFLVNDLRGMTARFEVRAGSVPGTSVLEVTPTPEKVYSGKVELDGNGTRALGRYRLSGLGQMNSPFGRGDGFTANALASTTGGLAFALLGYNTPLGSDGWKAGATLSYVRYQLDKDDFPLDLHGTALNVNLYGLYPVVRSRNLNLFAIASAELKQYEDSNLAATTKKNANTAALGATGDFRDSLLGGGVNTFDLAAVHGQLRYPDGRSSALDDDPNFTKVTYGFTRLQNWFTGRALVYFSVRGQYALNNLDTTEQFRLGGPDGVRAFASGEGTGDTGVVSSLELRLLPPEDWFGRIAREMVFSVFADGGYVQFRHQKALTSNPNAGTNHDAFGGVGLGLAWVRPGEWAARASLAKPVGDSARIGEPKRSVRLYFQLAKLFN